MRTLLLVVSAVFLSTCFAASQMPSTLTLMPVPAKIELGTGQLVIDQLFTVSVTGAKDARLDTGIPRFLDQLSRQTGMPQNKQPADSAKATLVIRCENAGRKVQELGEDESYTLEVTAARATHRPDSAGRTARLSNIFAAGGTEPCRICRTGLDHP